MELTSPNYPEAYDPLEDCSWIITAPQGHYVTLDFVTIVVSDTEIPTLFDLVHSIVPFLNIYVYFLQFNPHFNGDYISIQEIDANGYQKLLAYLTGTDLGPKSEMASSNWDKKIISTSTTKMNIEFKSDDSWQYKGFFTKIHFTPISNKECESWIDMTKKIFQSPNYPQSWHTKKCQWLITVDPDSHITLNIIELDVRFRSITSAAFLTFF